MSNIPATLADIDPEVIRGLQHSNPARQAEYVAASIDLLAQAVIALQP